MALSKLQNLFDVIFNKTRAAGMGMANIPVDEVVSITATEDSLSEEGDDTVPRLQLKGVNGAYDTTIFGVVNMRIFEGGTAAKLVKFTHTRALDKNKKVQNLKQYAATRNDGEPHLMDRKYKCIGHVPQFNSFARLKSEDKKLNNPVRFQNSNYVGYEAYQEAMADVGDKFAEVNRVEIPKLLRSALESDDPGTDERVMVPIFTVEA